MLTLGGACAAQVDPACNQAVVGATLNDAPLPVPTFQRFGLHRQLAMLKVRVPRGDAATHPLNGQAASTRHGVLRLPRLV